MFLSNARSSVLHRCVPMLSLMCIASTIFLLPGVCQGQIDWANTTGANAWYDWGINWAGGSAPNSSQTARFNQAAAYEVWWNGTTASTRPSVGMLDVQQGDVTFLNNGGGVQHLFTINGSGGTGAFSDFSIMGPDTSLTNRGLHLQSLGGGQILDGATLTLDGSHPQSAKLTVAGSTGFDVSGNLNVQAGGIFDNTIFGYIGRLSGSTGTATVTGSGSQWNNSSHLYVGLSGNGTLNVAAGGLVSNFWGVIGLDYGSSGTATVTGSGSQWNNSSGLWVGLYGNGTLNVWTGGVVNNTDGFIGVYSNSTGTATVTGSGSQWNHSGNLYIGGNNTSAGGLATLNIANSGLVSVGGTTRIWSGPNVNVNLTGGRFEFGETTLQEFGTINAVSGSMAGNLNHSGFTNVGTLTALQNQSVDLTDVTLTNSGTLHGTAALGISLINTTSGELFVQPGQLVRFGGYGKNSGEINNFGGAVRFEESLNNQASGFISGRGSFTANGGWTNDGVIAMSGGFSDVHGDLVNTAAGMIAIGGGSTTTFYDDVTMNAANMNMEIASNSYAVFFGSYNGGSNGLGTVQAFGDLRPGNSPAFVSFGGGLEMGVNTATFIELGGLLAGEFDQLQIAGDLLLNGSLGVSLIDGFSLGFNQEFLIADITGSRSGFFSGLGDGDLVGNFGGIDLFISYGAGNGNDISLFTAVPEPGAAGLLGCLLLGQAMSRRRRGC